MKSEVKKLVAAVTVQTPAVQVRDVPIVAPGMGDETAALLREEAAARAQLAAIEVRRKQAEARASVALEARANAEAVARRYWPKNKPLPEFHIKARRAPLPCPECKRVLLNDGGQNVACLHSGTDVARFRCRACGYTWMLPVKVVG